MDSGFGMARIKQEGAPAHPEDIYFHCGCKKCELRWQKQLKAYEDFQTFNVKESNATSTIK